jgi:DNA-binding response OmpR family regulator
MAKTILVVDDKRELRKLLQDYLAQEGYRVVTAADGREALYVARHEVPDLIILDIMMPEMDGYEFMRRHARERETPIIMLTAKVEEGEKVLGLELGADDYITKPFSLRELAARVKAVLRRGAKDQVDQEILRIADLTLDRSSRLVTVGDQRIELTPSEFDILAVLMASPGRAFSRIELLERLQGTTFEGYERTIDVHIRNLRTKIEPDPSEPRYVETVYGVGYRLSADRKGS